MNVHAMDVSQAVLAMRNHPGGGPRPVAANPVFHPPHSGHTAGIASPARS